MKPITDIALAKGIRAGESKSFEQLYRTYYVQLCAFCTRYLKDDIAAEEVVQSLIMKLWEKRSELNIPDNLQAYLFKSAYYNCLTYIRQNTSSNTEHLDDVDVLDDIAIHGAMETAELQFRIERAKKDLPEQTATIFSLSRDNEMSYPQIAEHLSISVKTVEYHITKALKHFRVSLKDYMFIFGLIGLGYCLDLVLTIYRLV